MSFNEVFEMAVIERNLNAKKMMHCEIIYVVMIQDYEFLICNISNRSEARWIHYEVMVTK